MAQYKRLKRIFPVALRGVRCIADASGLSVRQVNQMILDGLPVYQVGSRKICLVDDLAEFIRANFKRVKP